MALVDEAGVATSIFLVVQHAISVVFAAWVGALLGRCTWAWGRDLTYVEVRVRVRDLPHVEVRG
jgi:hypothetical protein